MDRTWKTDPDVTEVSTLPNVDEFDEDVSRVRDRSIEVLERVLALPDPPRDLQHEKHEMEHEFEFEARDAGNGKGAAAFFQPQPEIVLPDPMERYETRLRLLNAELDRIVGRNSVLKGHIRDLQTKLGAANLEEEQLRQTLDVSMKQRFGNALPPGFKG